jgi:phospholipase D-like protein
VTALSGTQRAAEHIIRRACGRLPASARDERNREWAAEICAILDDPRPGPAFLRSARALRYAAGIVRCSRHPLLSAGGPGRAGSSVAVRIAVGLGIYLGLVGLVIGADRVLPRSPWLLATVVGCCLCFDGFCLADLARADDVRYLPKWAWALACLVQSPFGGIMYLSAGRARS